MIVLFEVSADVEENKRKQQGTCRLKTQPREPEWFPDGCVTSIMGFSAIGTLIQT